MLDQEECYIFAATADDPRQSSKKRKATPIKSIGDVPHSPFVPLMRDVEKLRHVRERYEIFENLWRSEEEAIEKIIENANSRTVETVTDFVEAAFHEVPNCKIPTGLLVQGPENGASTGLFESLTKSLTDRDDLICITLTSGQSANLKTVLKNINHSVITQVDEDEEAISRGTRLLNYDLQILFNHVEARGYSKIVLLFEDSEAFDGVLLSDLIDIFSSWSDRIPFILLFGISTSIDLFQSRLSRNAIRSLRGERFDIEQIDIEELFKAKHRDPPNLFLGPGLSSLLLERQKDFIQSPLALIRALKYAYMTHLFSNPLSLLLDYKRVLNMSTEGHLTAIRHLPSFRSLVQETFNAKKYTAARELLNDGDGLVEAIELAVHETPNKLVVIELAVGLLNLIEYILQKSKGETETPFSELYVLAMSNKLAGSTLLENILVSLKRIRSNVLIEILDVLGRREGINALGLDIRQVADDFVALEASLEEDEVLRSSYDIQHSNLRTTVVAQKVELSRQAAKITPEEASYTKILDRFISTLTHCFQKALVNPQDLFLNEVFIYDVKSLHREVFMPRPRFAIERALSSPHDYLGCECCDSAMGGLSASQPATAIVYQLYLESGSVINTADLWSAFWTIVGPEDSEDEEAEREKALAIFSRALAELKYLGMIKNSRKKADHLAKLSWKGL